MEVVPTSDNPGYENNFDARKYLDEYYALNPKTLVVDNESRFLLKFLSDVFSSGQVRGQCLIEIGAGPTIHYIIPACEAFEDIYLTDYNQGNLDEIRKWLHCEKDAFDWSPYISFVCDLKNNGSTLQSEEEKIRRRVSLMKCDVTLDNPLHPNSLPLTDCVLIPACLTSACLHLTDLKMALKNLLSLIKPGGHLIIIDYLEASFYIVGGVRFPLLSIDENVFQEVVVESGCQIEDFQMFKVLPGEIFDGKTVFCLLARKP